MKLAAYEVRIAAPADVVWAHLTTAAGLVRWVGPDASADPVPGGVLRWTHPNGATVVGRFLELVPHRRLVFSYGWEDGRMGVPPESTTVVIDLVEQAGATTLRLSPSRPAARGRAKPRAGLGVLPRRPARPVWLAAPRLNGKPA